MPTYNTTVVVIPNGPATLTNAILNDGAYMMDATLTLNGNTINKGTINTYDSSHSGTNTIAIQTGRTLSNNGTISFHQNGSFGHAFNNITGGTLSNNGTVNVEGTATITADTIGKGSFVFAPPHSMNSYETDNGTGILPDSDYSLIEFDKYVGYDQKINMTNDGILALGDLRNFHGTVQGFSSLHQDAGLSKAIRDTIDIKNEFITSVRDVGNAASGSRLELFNGQRLAGTIKFDAYSAGFSVTHVGADSLIRL